MVVIVLLHGRSIIICFLLQALSDALIINTLASFAAPAWQAESHGPRALAKRDGARRLLWKKLEAKAAEHRSGYESQRTPNLPAFPAKK